jgi:hypothetical protein
MIASHRKKEKKNEAYLSLSLSLSPDIPQSGIPVSLETLNIFFKCLHAKSNLLSPDMVEELKQLYAAHHLPTPVQVFSVSLARSASLPPAADRASIVL